MLYHAKILLHHAFLWENINYDTLKYFRVKCYNDDLRALADLICVRYRNVTKVFLAPLPRMGFILFLVIVLRKASRISGTVAGDRASISIFGGCVKKYQQAFLAPLPGKALE